MKLRIHQTMEGLDPQNLDELEALVEEALKESAHLAPAKAAKLREDLERLKRVRTDTATLADLMILRSGGLFK